MWLLICSIRSRGRIIGELDSGDRRARATGEEDTMSKDPVCGMQLAEASAAAKTEYKGKTYYFCSPACKATFDKKPEKYASK